MVSWEERGRCLHASKISSTGSLNSFPIFSANGRLGSYFSVSIALIVWRETASFSASSPCDHSRAVRSSLRRFFMDGSAVTALRPAQASQHHEDHEQCDLPG